MLSNLTDVFVDLGRFTIATAAIGWLAKALMTHWLSKDAEQFKGSLRRKADIAIEELRNDLRLKSIEHEITFRSIHARQATVIAEVYAKLHTVHSAVASYVKMLELESEPNKDEKRQLVYDAHEDFREHFFPNRIFFPRDTGCRVKHLADRLAQIANIFTFGQRIAAQDARTRTVPETPATSEYWSKCAEMVEKEIPPLMDLLEADFQRLLGVRRSAEPQANVDTASEEPKSRSGKEHAE